MSANGCSKRVRVEAQTWGNVSPYPPHTMYRAACKCGWVGLWHTYRENVDPVHVSKEHLPLLDPLVNKARQPLGEQERMKAAG